MKKTISWLHFLKNIILHNLNLANKPFRLFIVITKKCNSKCISCNIWNEQIKDELTLIDFEKLAKNSNFISWLNFTGGEPFLRDDIFEILQTFYKHCPHLLMFNLTTNGLLTKNILRFANQLSNLKIPIVQINVSIDGPEKINDQIRGITGDYQKALHTYIELRKIKGIKSKIALTIYENNLDVLESFINDLKKEIPGFKESEIHLNLPHTSTHFYQNSNMNFFINKQRLKKLYALLNNMSLKPVDIFEKIYRKLSIKFIEQKTIPIKCNAIRSSLFISETGEVHPCTIWNNNLGKIQDSKFNLLEIINNENSQFALKTIDAKKCPTCWTPCEAYPSIMSNLSKSFFETLKN